MKDLFANIVLAASVFWPNAQARALQANAANFDWSAVETALGRKGASQPGGVMRFSFPRSDAAVTVSGVSLKPAFALGAWVAFKPVGQDRAIAMGDLVLLEGEIPAVTDVLQKAGITQTAIHNHVLNESPRIMYMHVSANGPAATIATAIHDALATTRTPLGTPAAPASPSAADLDTAAVAKALGVSGRLNGTVYQVSIPRAERITDMNVEVPPSMGVATAINFQPTASGRALITGDFVLLANEVNPVIEALRANGIQVTALHSHMLDEQPRLLFMHFWGNDDAAKLATGLNAALAKTNSKK